MYSSTLPSTSALDGGDGQRHDPAALAPRMTRYSLYRRMGRPQGRSGRKRKSRLQRGFDPRTVKSEASRYTDQAIAAPFVVIHDASNGTKSVLTNWPGARVT